ncbi:DnaB-like helicase C-terminal domain-containing protein [Chengkuizengella marina]|uniref:Replicative DNA helicase n=1 Tax=Chengkuizengella marina TaxID=2507566 RepID=A0A6N9Q802_9BACL|nr:DnaB-like helicase C-terminal domain-containing protein [Chengkuizengella marina]NBI31006.1 replicative DNA helicase [Chengkuizengella marina]
MIFINNYDHTLQDKSEMSEAYFTALFWNNPELYNMYPKSSVDVKTFQNKVYGFFFGLGRHMHEKELTSFDDISSAKFVKQLNIENKYSEYGGYETIGDIISEVYDKEENVQSYYNDVKKYSLLKKLCDLFGEKVLRRTDKYNYEKMSNEQLQVYWEDKVNQISLGEDSHFDEYNLLEGLKDGIQDWNENPATGLPFYQSKHMTNICTGWDYGNLYILGGFGGSGKTSMSFNKVVMSCIEKQEKLLIIANEQSITEFKKMLIVTAMGTGTEKSIKRQKLNEGNFSKEEFEKMSNAVDWVHKLCEGELDLIKFVFMENYVMDDVKRIVRHYNTRGYRRILIDTGKPSEGGVSQQRWERFTDDFKELYKLARPDGGGLNVSIWVNVQLSDAALKSRFLNEHAFGESKKIKNEASVVFMIRAVWADEYEGGDRELKCYNYVKNDEKNNPFENSKYIKDTFTLSKEDIYYLDFTPKNRRGQDNKTGLDVLVMKVNFNNNTWDEVGWTTVRDDKNY